ncbi:MAG: PstS family phosphate ABC transporter substrate-binding protein [Rhodospirillales bacterium]|nr:PstS family phosphate ABC transporter substrate-binding protein [Rhodospirillales bacterium]
MFRSTIALGAAVALTASLATSAANARDQIRIVGSSTVYPFATVVAEKFGKSSHFKTPVIESTGSGGGFKLFCAGLGEGHPDITNASRAIKKSEVENCAKNGIRNITEVKIGYDGIVIANSRDAEVANLTKRQIFLALAKDIPDGKGGFKANDYIKWSDIDASLPNRKIEVMGPPPTSGTRDAFVELAMEGGCGKIKEIAALKKTDKNIHKAVCQSIREDGAFVEAGENDVLIVRKLEANPNAFGIFGFSFLDQNGDKVQGSLIDGKSPTFENIASGAYGVSRPLFFYVKNDQAKTVPGIREYLAEFASENAWGEEGYLSDKGLIPMPAAERKKYMSDAKNLTTNIMM